MYYIIYDPRRGVELLTLAIYHGFDVVVDGEHADQVTEFGSIWRARCWYMQVF